MALALTLEVLGLRTQSLALTLKRLGLGLVTSVLGLGSQVLVNINGYTEDNEIDDDDDDDDGGELTIPFSGSLYAWQVRQQVLSCE